jgi:ribosomal protein L32
MPCADAEATPVHKISHFKSDEKHTHDKQNDLCSPFCACNCCGIQILSNHSNDVIEFPIQLSFLSQEVPNYKSVFASNFYGSIWQPPQIV